MRTSHAKLRGADSRFGRFLRKYGHSSVGINFLIGAFIIQWHMLCGGFFEQLFQSEGHFHKIELTLQSLLLGDFAAAVVLSARAATRRTVLQRSVRLGPA